MFEIDCYSVYSCGAEATKAIATFSLSAIWWLCVSSVCLYSIGWIAGKILPYVEHFHAYLQKRLS